MCLFLLGGSASLELELKPDPAAAYPPPPPLRTEVKKEKEQRNPLVPISEPLTVNIGEPAAPPGGAGRRKTAGQ